MSAIEQSREHQIVDEGFIGPRWFIHCSCDESFDGIDSADAQIPYLAHLWR